MPYDPDAPLYNQDYLDWAVRVDRNPESLVTQQMYGDELAMLTAAGFTI